MLDRYEPEAGGEEDGQSQLLEKALSGGAGAVVLVPSDPGALPKAVEMVQAADVPLVVLGSAASVEGCLCAVGTDEAVAGSQAARRLAKLVGGAGDIIVVRHGSGTSAPAVRERAFEETMRSRSPNVRVVAAETGGETDASAMAVVEDMLSRAPGLRGVFASSESTTYGALRALRAFGVARRVRLVGFGTAPPLVAGLASGEVDTLVVPRPFVTGYQSVAAVVRHLRGEPVRKRIDTGVTLVTPETVGAGDAIRFTPVNPGTERKQ